MYLVPVFNASAYVDIVYGRIIISLSDHFISCMENGSLAAALVM